MHANAATALEEYIKPGAKVLDVGCGSGYLTAVKILNEERTLGIEVTVGFREDGSTWGKGYRD